MIAYNWLQKYLRSSLWMVGGRLIQMLCGVGLMVAFARLLSKDAFGQYQFVFSIFSLYTFLSMPGTATATLKAVSRGKEGTYLSGTVFSLKWAIVGSIGLVIGAAYYKFTSNGLLFRSLLLLAPLFPAYSSLRMWRMFFEGREKFELRSAIEVIVVVLRTVCVFVAILYNSPIELIILIYVGTESILNIGIFLIIRSQFELKEVEKRWKNSAYKLSIVTLLSSIYDHLDKILIGIFLGPASVAVYTIAASLAAQLRHLLYTGISTTFPSILSRESRAIDARHIIALGGLSMIGLIPIYFILPYVITNLYSDAYVESIRIARYYLLTIPIYISVAIYSKEVVRANNENYQIISVIFGSVGNIISYLIFIPKLGIIGAVIGSIIYYLIQLLILSSLQVLSGRTRSQV